MKTNQILINLFILAGSSLLFNLIPADGLAHAPEFHLPNKTIETQETEDLIEDSEPVISEEVQAVNVTRQANNLQNISSESLALLVLINPLILYLIRNQFLGIRHSKTHF